MSYRMSSVQFMTNYQSSLNKTYQKQAKLLEQGDGSSIHRGSDDPVAYSKLLRYKVSVNENEQYTRNVQTATAWMQTTDIALTHIAEITKTFKEKTIEAATDVNGDADFDAIAKEMWAMIEEIYATSKAQHDGRYVFSGQKDKTEPFTLTTETQERAVTKTLNASQASFFKGVSTTAAGTVYQMLVVQDKDNNTYYLDLKEGKLYSENFVDSGYKEWVTKGKGYRDIDSIAESDTGVYSSVETDNVNSDTAVSGLSGFLGMTVTDKNDKDKAAEQTRSSLENLLSNVKYSSDSSATRQLTYLYEVSQASDSGTQITKILQNEGITTDAKVTDAFKNFLTDRKTDIEKYGKPGISYYFSNQGTVYSDTTISLAIGGEKKDFTIVTEKQSMVKYHGDSNYISMVKMNGATDTAADVVNAIGRDLFGSDIFDGEDSGYGTSSGSSMINNMLAVYNKVKAGDVKWLSADGVLLADAANAVVTNSQTTVGARLQLYTSVGEMLANQSDNITEEITNVSGTDVARMATNLMEMTTLYNMALALGGRVLPQSLADYL